MNIRSLLVICGTALLAVMPAFAADSGPAPAAKPDPLAPARDAIKQKNWAAAVNELKQINAKDSADWNNLMGYSLRKMTPPDYAAAERYYNDALMIDPKHKDALEYSGELYLILGKLPEAEQRLATLDKACFFPCGQYTDLKKAVARYKAAGNKYVAE
jgi:tetratricopeptide (TPR) repeat protein